MKCIVRVIGRVPSSADNLNPREQLLVARQCLSGGGDQIEGGPTTPHIPDGTVDDFTRCAIAVLGRIPSENEDLTGEERSRIAEKCSDFQRDGGPDTRTSSGAGGPDPETLKCIVGVLGRTPSSSDDFTDDEKRLVGQKCFAGQHRGGAGTTGGGPSGAGDHDDGRGELNEETLQCIVDTIGRVPEGPEDLTNEEKRLLGQKCFRSDHEGGPDGSGRPGGPGDLDEETLQCITATIGRLPEGPDDLSNEEKRRIGQACFGERHGGPGGPGDLDEETLQCIVDTIGRLPEGPDDLSNEEKRRVGQACFAGEHGGQGGPGGPGDLDEETLQCIVDTIGRLPEGPDDLSNKEKRRVGQACFGGDHGGPGDLDQETLDCIVNTIGRLPSGPDDLTNEEKRLIGRACFDDQPEGPDDLDEETRQCIIDVLGYLPNGPEELSSEELDLVVERCFDGVREGPEGPEDLDEVTRQCIIGLIGRIPTSHEDVTEEEKRLIGRECFGGPGAGRGTEPVAAGLSEESRQCIVGIVGRIPSRPDDLSDADKIRIGQECFQRRPSSARGQPSGAPPSTAVSTQPEPVSPPEPGADDQSVEASSPPQPATEVEPQPEPAASTEQPAAGEDQPDVGAIAEPAAPPPFVLTPEQAAIQRIVKNYNEIPGVDVIGGVIGNLEVIRGSRTAAINVLSVVNPLLAKGRAVTDEEWAEVFEKLKEATFVN